MLSLLLGGGMAVLGGVTSAMGAAESNKQAIANAERQMAATAAAAKANQVLNDQATKSQLKKLSSQFSQYTKAAEASSAFRNVFGSSSSEALRRASMAAALEDVSNIQRQGRSQEANIFAQAQSEFARAQSIQLQSPWLAGIQGGLQGLSAGLALGSAFSAAGIGAPAAATGGASTAGASGFGSPTAQSIGGFRYA
jgi:hypothetical protein